MSIPFRWHGDKSMASQAKCLRREVAKLYEIVV